MHKKGDSPLMHRGSAPQRTTTPNIKLRTRLPMNAVEGP